MTSAQASTDLTVFFNRIDRGFSVLFNFWGTYIYIYVSLTAQYYAVDLLLFSPWWGRSWTFVSIMGLWFVLFLIGDGPVVCAFRRQCTRTGFFICFGLIAGSHIVYWPIRRQCSYLLDHNLKGLQNALQFYTEKGPMELSNRNGYKLFLEATCAWRRWTWCWWVNNGFKVMLSSTVVKHEISSFWTHLLSFWKKFVFLSYWVFIHSFSFLFSALKLSR